MYKIPAFRPCYSVMAGIVLMLSPPLFAEESSLPVEPQEKSPATESIQAEVDK